VALGADGEVLLVVGEGWQWGRRLLGAERLHTVLRFLDDLRAAGQDRDFRDNLWNRLQDEALLDRADLAESLSQMNAGNVRAALTSDEESEGH